MSHSEKIDAAQFPEFKPHCEDCAGLCCVIPEIWTSDRVVVKTVNRVCEHLLTDTSKSFPTCNIYPHRKDMGYSVCCNYSCSGAWQFITSYLRKNGRIREDGTVDPEGVVIFDLFTRIAWFLEVEIHRLREVSIFSSKKRREFVMDCFVVYQQFITNSELILPNGERTSAELLRQWFLETYRAKFDIVSGFLGISVSRREIVWDGEVEDAL